MVDTRKIKSLIVDNGLTQSKVATKMNISYQSLSLKLNNKREFKANEIFALCKILNIVDNQMQIFFADVVDL